MNATSAEQVYEQIVKALPALERLRLVEKIIHDLTMSGDDARPKWGDYKGIVQYPLCGEDAQAWVSRGRREADEHREALLRRSHDDCPTPC